MQISCDEIHGWIQLDQQKIGINSWIGVSKEYLTNYENDLPSDNTHKTKVAKALVGPLVIPILPPIQ